MDTSFNFDPDYQDLKVVLVCIVILVLFASAALFAFCMLEVGFRRRERMSLFVDLIGTGISDHRHLEETLVSIAASRDPSLGIRFHWFAALLEQGLSFQKALDAVPRWLSPQIVAMLKAGADVGDIRKVLPACRKQLNDVLSAAQSDANYLLILCAFLVLPMAFCVSDFLVVFVLPKFIDIAQELGAEISPFLVQLKENQFFYLGPQVPAFLILYIVVVLASPKSGFYPRWLTPVIAPFQYSLPWQRKRMQRDFSAMLAVLLDAGMPEDEALGLAGDCAANAIFQKRVARAQDSLRHGMKLTQAVEMIDDAGEFRWRLTQAMGGQGGFVRAIAGWNEALDAKAYQQEQATAQVITTALVVLNGIFVGVIAFAVFSMLISINNQGLLW